MTRPLNAMGLDTSLVRRTSFLRHLGARRGSPGAQSGPEILKPTTKPHHPSEQVWLGGPAPEVRSAPAQAAPAGGPTSEGRAAQKYAAGMAPVLQYPSRPRVIPPVRRESPCSRTRGAVV